jgi:hypothetical protein
MRLLYLIFVLCVASLIWIAFSIARHIRRQEAPALPPEGSVLGLGAKPVVSASAGAEKRVLLSGQHRR